MYSFSITTTLLLPLIGYTPAMAGQQTLSIVYVNGADEGGASIAAGLRWWEARVGVRFGTVESRLDVGADLLALNVCRDRSWLPKAQAMPTLYVVDDWLVCDGVIVAGYAVPGTAILSAPLREDEAAHEIGHVWGATDGHHEARGDIMDYRAMKAAFERGYVAGRTFVEVGASPSGASGRAATAQQGRQPGARRVEVSYSYERFAGAF
jgi:hypothetical protein